MDRPLVDHISSPPHRGEAIVVCGFAMAVGAWCAWFITHLPWLGLGESGAAAIVIGVWLGSAALAGRAAPAGASLRVGLGAGVLSGVLGLLVLGSKLVEPEAGGLKPAAGMIAAGFLVLSGVIGLVGGAIGGALGRRGDHPRPGVWLARMGVVTIAAAAPLLFIGGLVTSTDSGMAVPDWPRTYGANMFLYPLGARAAADVYLEHSHRLFGTLVGLAGLVLMVWVLRRDGRGWVKGVAIGAFGLICIQGVLGGGRVLWGDTDAAQDSRVLAMVHGVLAQLVLVLLVGLAAFLSGTFRAEPGPPGPGARRLRALWTGLLHATVLQLVFGAAYRHLRAPHALWTHAGFSVVVVLMAVLAGSAAAAYGGEGRLARAIRLTGRTALLVVGVQFVLGWAALGMGTEREARGIAEALVRTTHQANGALVLALAALGTVWARRAAGLEARRDRKGDAQGGERVAWVLEDL